MVISQNQRSQAPINSMSIQSIEISIHHLIKSWDRKQKLELFLNSRVPLHQDQCQSRAPWRNQLTSFLESNVVHVIAILLLLTDLTITILELSSSLFSCTPAEEELGHVWYHWVGIAILGLLCLKTIALMVGLGVGFLKRPGYIIDGVVLMVALVLEGILERKGGGLVVVVSLWRVVRVVETAFELSDEAIEAQIQSIVCQFEALRDENARLLETIVEKDKVIEMLQEECDPCRHA